MRLDSRWRIVSIAVLIIYAALVVLCVLLLVRNIGLAILLGVTSMSLAYTFWLMFAGTGEHISRARWFAIAAAVMLALELLILLTDKQNRRALLVISGLTLVYLALFGLLRKKYWTVMRQQNKLHDNTAKFRNPYLIINPKAGDGRAMKAHVDELARQQGIRVIMTKKGVDVAESAMEAVRAGADVLGISGGDGSIGAVAKVAIDHGLPIVVLPGGTRCHFARDMGLDPNEIADSLAGFTGVESRVDVGDINGRIFLNNASFGLYADIVNHPEYREHKMEVSRKALQEVVAGTKDPYDLRFNLGDTAINKAIQVLVGINRYTTMNMFELGHRQRLDEGVLQVTAITELNNKLVKRLLTKMSIKRPSSQVDLPGLYQWVDKTIVVKSADKKIAVGVDGESEAFTTPVKIRIRPGALRIFIPAEGVRSRRKNPLSTQVIRKVWQTAWQ